MPVAWILEPVPVTHRVDRSLRGELLSRLTPLSISTTSVGMESGSGQCIWRRRVAGRDLQLVRDLRLALTLEDFLHRHSPKAEKPVPPHIDQPSEG